MNFSFHHRLLAGHPFKRGTEVRNWKVELSLSNLEIFSVAVGNLDFLQSLS